MMVTFCSALFLVVPNKSWIVMPVVSHASVPVTLFVFMQFPLLVEIFISTYGRGIFDREGQALDTNF
ncbi:hypothetical protein RchiOBHm_Chr4g0416381 [Rosa chinensis]|uniref:Uncharacterized protein n=1 Tax=Rosa chinensis TaxID=74649 RepID=A0A2P6QWX3_ROSCH|nr:hypothetical protein RchiOBHm_Chr4g0416381 [Rosa chinensis]